MRIEMTGEGTGPQQSGKSGFWNFRDSEREPFDSVVDPEKQERLGKRRSTTEYPAQTESLCNTGRTHNIRSCGG